MFVEIENADMNVFDVDTWINTVRDANGGIISPELAMDVLKKTNHYGHIKKILKNIKKACSDENEKLVADKVLAYNEFILSCVDGREMSPQAMDMLQELADVLGNEFKDKLEKAKEGWKYYKKDCCDNTVWVGCDRDYEKINNTEEKIIIFYGYAEGDVILYKSIIDAKEIKFREGAKVLLDEATIICDVLDLSMCSQVSTQACDLCMTDAIKFKNEKQKRDFLFGEYRGKIIYVGDEYKVNTLPVNGGAEM